MIWPKRTDWIIVCSIVSVAMINFSLTGAMIPLWSVERLESPCVVKSIGNSDLELEDGRRIGLPFIKTLPRNNPLFEKAVSSGIEISPQGDAYGLMWQERSCGLDTYVWRKVRVNLSELAAALHPDGIDDSLIHPEAIAFIREHKSIDLTAPTASQRKLQLKNYERINLGWIHRQFEWSTVHPSKQPD